MKKFVASDKISYLGKVYDTEEEAQRAARGLDFYLDSLTGYSTAFNCEVSADAEVVEIEDQAITIEEYLAMMKEKKEGEKKLNEKIAQIKRDFYAQYMAKTYNFINLNTPYNYNDIIRIVTRRASGRKRVLEGHVYSVYITEKGEIRPSIKRQSYPIDEQILSIEVLERFEPTEIRQQVVCKNCKFFTRNKPYIIGKEEQISSIGFCSVHQKEVLDYQRNQYDCYDNDPTSVNYHEHQ